MYVHGMHTYVHLCLIQQSLVKNFPMYIFEDAHSNFHSLQHLHLVLMMSYCGCSDDVILQLLFSQRNPGFTPSSAIMCNYCKKLACQHHISSHFSSPLHMFSLSPRMGSVWHKVVSLSVFFTPVSLTCVVSASVSVD